jgi:hypothetical protein
MVRADDIEGMTNYWPILDKGPFNFNLDLFYVRENRNRETNFPIICKKMVIKNYTGFGILPDNDQQNCIIGSLNKTKENSLLMFSLPNRTYFSSRAFSIVAWVRMQWHWGSDENFLFSCRHEKEIALGIGVYEGGQLFAESRFNRADQEYGQTGFLKFGLWTHLAFTVYDSKAIMYANGVRVFIENEFFDEPASRGFADCAFGVNFDLDDMRFFDRWLEDFEVQSYYKKPKSVVVKVKLRL